MPTSQSSLPRSPSALAQSISALHLDEQMDAEEVAAGIGTHESGSPQIPSPVETERLLQATSDRVADISRAIFRIEEVRHAKALSSTDAGGGSSSAGNSGTSNVDEAFMELNSLLEEVSGSMRIIEKAVSALAGLDDAPGQDSLSGVLAGARRRRGSAGSLDSFTSFDEAAADISDATPSSESIVRHFQQLTEHWASAQVEAERVKQELSEDRYLTVFRGLSSQATGMMDSLDKAIVICADFISSVQQKLASSPAHPNSREEELDEEEETRKKLEDLKSRRSAFEVKRQHYGPACERVFGVLERGLKERATAHGSMLRRYRELKQRWKSQRDAMSRIDKELRRAEVALSPRSRERIPSDAAHSASSPASSAAELSVGSPASSLRPRPGPKSSSRELRPTAHRTPSSSSLASAATSPPPKPPKSSRRQSMIDAPPQTSSPSASRSRPISSVYAQGVYKPGAVSHASPNAPSPRAHGRSASTNPVPSHTAGERGYTRPGHAPSFSTSTHSSAIDPVERFGIPQSGRTTPGGTFLSPMRRTRPLDVAGPPTSYRTPSGLSAALNNNTRSKTPQPTPTWSRGSSEPPPDRPPSRNYGNRRNSSIFHGPSPLDRMKAEQDLGDTSVDSIGSNDSGRPGSAAGIYYRPPSSASTATGERGSKRHSMIPRLSFPASNDHNGDSPHSRPGSALSHASTAAYAAAGASPARTYQGGNRSTMQTPEPVLAARVQRLSMFARPSKGTPATSAMGGVYDATGSPAARRSSRPPPARYNAHVTSPLNINKSGRTTPLSAAALAKLPDAGPPGPRSISGSSVANYRAARAGGTAGLGSSANQSLSGRATPTFSEGASSVGAFSALGGARAQLEHYRPNQNDALDVEVAHIANSLGVYLERVTDPLPRGVRSEPRPGQEIQAQYSIGGGKAVMCKLLELHRPQSSAGARSGTKVRKILARVGGGWMDLEQHILNKIDEGMA
ncbi:Growth-arrest-specific protein 2 domain [Ceraceosorus bombacis]|uniref:Growth-arrest-specific protein 2 domain n=1 Tax=Ceraceosorus bombacis TaxID=401625 RepID=A0A0P1B8R6_9BASI|nr:Growth-arrest-specific protein 2 domain [Ceraceosorus bombacis]